eukprot:11204893-Lingulodinium_polyedra.AAC.1
MVLLLCSGPPVPGDLATALLEEAACRGWALQPWRLDQRVEAGLDPLDPELVGKLRDYIHGGL